jgi:hypothetical protein
MKIKNKSAQALGRLGGKTKSKAKSKAAKENGKLGGRPKKEVQMITLETIKEL